MSAFDYAAERQSKDTLDVERLALAIHRMHNPGSKSDCRHGSLCREEATAIAREYAALAKEVR